MTDETKTTSGEVQEERRSTEPTRARRKGDPTTRYDGQKEREERRLKHWIAKMVVGTLCLSFILTMMAMAYVFAAKGERFNVELINQFFEIIKEIVEALK